MVKLFVILGHLLVHIYKRLRTRRLDDSSSQFDYNSSFDYKSNLFDFSNFSSLV